MDDTSLDLPELFERSSAWTADAVTRIENDDRLDAAVGPMQSLARPLAQGGSGSALRGEWLGHALHPLLTDFPMGCWLSAGLLDLFGGRSARKASQRLVFFGLVATVPTVASGLVDWSTIEDERTRRVGVVHAVGNGGVALCYVQSWRARRKRRHVRGMLWGYTGGMLAWFTGYLGGHLSFGRGVGHGIRRAEKSQPAGAFRDSAADAWLGTDAPTRVGSMP